LTVSVIVPNYNHAKYLRQRIDSILNQTFRDFELIVLDDASKDNSIEIINEYKSKYPDIITFFNSINSGNPFSQWNLGAGMARGEFLWIAESDDYAEPDFLDRMVKKLKNSKYAGLVFCDSKIVNEERHIEYLASERPAVKNYNDLYEALCGNREFSLKSFVENPIVNVSSVLFRISAFTAVGQADTSMQYCSDWLLYIKILLKSGIIYLSETHNIFRLHSDSQYHQYYQSKKFFAEKMRIYLFMIQHAHFSFFLYLLIMKKIVKNLILRLIYILKLEFILPGLPRVPAVARNLAQILPKSLYLIFIFLLLSFIF
jgi:glycosyltransferase involved in cell wall biosynthesis